MTQRKYSCYDGDIYTDTFPPPYLPDNTPPACHLDTQFNDGNTYLPDASYTTSKVQDDDVSTTIAKERLADDDSSQIPTQSLTYDMDIMDISPTEPVLDSDQHITQQGEFLSGCCYLSADHTAR